MHWAYPGFSAAAGCAFPIRGDGMKTEDMTVFLSIPTQVSP